MGPKTKSTKATAHAPEEAAAVWVDIGQLTPWAKNPRKNESAIPKVVESIKRFGFAAPIIARKNGEVIAGHTRLLAAEALGMDRVPVRYMDLDPAEAHLLALADNRLNEFAEWDKPVLQEIMSGYGLEAIDVAGWNESEAASITGAIDEVDWSAIEDFPEKSEFRTASFRLTEDQFETVMEAIEAAKKMAGVGEGTGNDNRNGNALTDVCAAFITAGLHER